MKRSLITLSLCLAMGFAAVPRVFASALPEAYQPAALALEAGNYKAAAGAMTKLPDANERNAMLTLAYRMSGDSLRSFYYGKKVSNIDEAAYTISTFYVERLPYSPNARKVLLEMGKTVADPDQGMAWLAGIHEAKGAMDSAMQLYTLGHEAYPKSAKLASGLANQYLKKGDAEKAILYFTRAYLLEGNEPGHMIGLGHAYYMDGRPDKALDLWNRALVLDPTNATLYKDIQRVQSELRGETPKAEPTAGVPVTTVPGTVAPGAAAPTPEATAPESGTAGGAAQTEPQASPIPAGAEQALKQAVGLFQAWMRK